MTSGQKQTRYQLIVFEALRDLPDPFTSEQVIEWFAKHYPDRYERTSLTGILRQMSANKPFWTNRQWSRLVRNFRVLYQITDNEYRRLTERDERKAASHIEPVPAVQP